jgi:hypothetical protein
MLAVLMQVFATFALVTVLWALYAYSLAFKSGPFNTIVGGFSAAFLSGITPDTLSGVIPEYVYVVFQLTFAAITPALIVGGFAERIKFSAVLWFMGLWLTLVYAPIAHMVWGVAGSPRWGKDFAGGTVVHVNAGIAAWVGCLVLGRRAGYGRRRRRTAWLTMVGASLLGSAGSGSPSAARWLLTASPDGSSTPSLLPHPRCWLDVRRVDRQGAEHLRGRVGRCCRTGHDHAGLRFVGTNGRHRAWRACRHPSGRGVPA